MAPKKDSPNRRRSIAVTNQSKPTILPRSKRRPHSIVPGDRLSPFAKARRSLAPRKSILKAVPINFTDESHADSQQLQLQSQPQSQSSTQTSIGDANATQSMDLTHDFHTKVHDNPSRKSFGRRVSFAEHAHVRLFEKPDKNYTSSTGSPQSSPAPSSPVDDRASPSQPAGDENAYPGVSRNRRRSSARYSMASEGEDMDLTTIGPSAFLLGTQTSESALLDDEEDDYGDDMDVTEAINGAFLRKRSLSSGLERRPLSQAKFGDSDPASEHSDTADRSRSFSEGGSMSQSDSSPDQSQAMEFTIPISQSLRPPAHQDEAWLALRQVTHSGDTPYELEPPPGDEHDLHNEGNGGMDLDDAVQRLMRARDSLPLSQTSQGDSTEEYTAYAAQTFGQQDDTFSSTDDSFGDDNGDRTMNVSKVLGRASLGGGDARMSMGYPDSSMDESEIYGAIVPPAQSTPRPSQSESHFDFAPESIVPPEPGPPRAAVFQPPPSEVVAPPSIPIPQTPAPSIVQSASAQSRPALTIPVPFSFTPKAPTSPSKSKATVPIPSSPSKFKPRPTFSAAFAPSSSRLAPKKSVVPHSQNKRPISEVEGSDAENQDIDKPSPAKRAATGETRPSIFSATARPVYPPTTNDTTAPQAPRPQPLSPKKKTPVGAPLPVPARRPTTSMRRPSGYFARRKSLGVGLGVAPAVDVEESTPASKVSPKKAGLGPGRVSMGSAPSDAWTRFDKNAGSGVAADKVSVGGKEKEKDAETYAREAIRLKVAVPSPTRRSPAPASPRPRSPAVLPPDDLPHSTSPLPGVVDLSGLLGSGGFGEDAGEADTEVDMDPTEQWRDGVEQQEFVEEEPPISIEQFFTITGIKFMDELTAPRRSVHQPTRQARSPEDIPLAEYVTAMGIDVPQLDLYSRVSKDLQAWMSKSKSVLAQAEDEAAKITPELFAEYARADEEGQAELLHQLKLIRTNTRGLAKSDWYDWKLQWVEGLRLIADNAFTALETDAKILEAIKVSADEIVPALTKEYEELMRELGREQAEVAEIEESDQGYLNELKTSIAEQNVEVEALQAEVSESKAQLGWLQERLDEIESQKREAITAIADAERVMHIQKHSTRVEVFRLKDELEALEDLHMFRATKVTSDVFEYVHDSKFRVCIPCHNFMPLVAKVDVTRVDKARTRSKDDFPRLSDFLLNAAKQQVATGDDSTVRQIVHRLGDYWSSCVQLRSQLKLLTIKYPVEIEIPQPPQDSPTGFKAKATVLFPSVKAKAFISFVFNPETFCSWPMSIASLGCEVKVAYGAIDRGTILQAVTERLSQASVSENYACLLDACIEAQEVYRLI